MNDRRSFLTTATLAATGISAGATGGPSPERQVADFVERYGHSTAVTRTPAATPQVKIEVRIDDFTAFADAYSGPHRLPLGKVRAVGNRLSFEHRGVQFQIDHVV